MSLCRNRTFRKSSLCRNRTWRKNSDDSCSCIGGPRDDDETDPLRQGNPTGLRAPCSVLLHCPDRTAPCHLGAPCSYTAPTGLLYGSMTRLPGLSRGCSPTRHRKSINKRTRGDNKLPIFFSVFHHLNRGESQTSHRSCPPRSCPPTTGLPRVPALLPWRPDNVVPGRTRRPIQLNFFPALLPWRPDNVVPGRARRAVQLNCGFVLVFPGIIGGIIGCYRGRQLGALIQAITGPRQFSEHGVGGLY